MLNRIYRQVPQKGKTSPEKSQVYRVLYKMSLRVPKKLWLASVIYNNNNSNKNILS